MRQLYLSKCTCLCMKNESLDIFISFEIPTKVSKTKSSWKDTKFWKEMVYVAL